MSNTQQIKTTLEKLLNGNNPFVAMLSGEWGIGKTHFWKESVKKDKDEREAYISLFGHNSLDDIKSAIMTEVSMIQYEKFKEFTDRTKDLQILGVGVGGLFSMLTKEDLENIIICFDDFERLSNNLDLKDVLGLISYLKEEKKCKIVMILNENELDIEVESHGQSRSEIFAKKKEKIVDYSFHYMPSYDESFEIVRTDIEYFNKERIKSFFEKIELKNIRIMKQVISQLNHFAFIEKYNLDDKVIEEFVEIALNLFVFKAKCNLSYEEYNNICSYKYSKLFMNSDILSEYVVSEDDLDFKENKEYDKCISHILEFESSNKDKLEKIVYNFIDTMIIDEENLKSLLSENHTNVHSYTIRKEILSLINDYRYNFKVDDKKVSKEINKIIIKYKDELHHIYTYETFKSIKQKHLQGVLDSEVEKEIIKNYIKSYPKSGDLTFDSHATIELIKKDYEWVEEYISSLHIGFKDISKDDIKKIMSQYARDGSYNIFDSSHKLNSISIEKFKSFITEDKEFVEILIKFLIKRPVPNGFEVDEAIESIEKALLELKKQDDIYARKVDFIVEKAKIKF